MDTDAQEFKEFQNRVFKLIGVETLEQFGIGRQKLIKAIDSLLREEYSLVAMGSDMVPHVVVNARLEYRLTSQNVASRILSHLLQGRRIISVKSGVGQMNEFATPDTIKRFFNRSYAAVAGH